MASVYLRVRASFYQVTETITTVLSPSEVDALLAEVIVDTINRLAPRQDEEIPEHTVEAMRSALRHGSYGHAAELGHQGVASIAEGPDGWLFKTICLACLDHVFSNGVVGLR